MTEDLDNYAVNAIGELGSPSRSIQQDFQNAIVETVIASCLDSSNDVAPALPKVAPVFDKT